MVGCYSIGLSVLLFFWSESFSALWNCGNSGYLQHQVFCVGCEVWMKTVERDRDCWELLLKERTDCIRRRRRRRIAEEENFARMKKKNQGNENKKDLSTCSISKRTASSSSTAGVVGATAGLDNKGNNVEKTNIVSIKFRGRKLMSDDGLSPAVMPRHLSNPPKRSSTKVTKQMAGTTNSRQQQGWQCRHSWRIWTNTTRGPTRGLDETKDRGIGTWSWPYPWG